MPYHEATLEVEKKKKLLISLTAAKEDCCFQFRCTERQSQQKPYLEQLEMPCLETKQKTGSGELSSN